MALVKRVPLVAAVLLLAAGAAPSSAMACGGTDQVVTAKNRQQAATAIRCLITQERKAHGLRRLKPNPSLRRAATSFAHTLVRRGEFAHEISGVPDLGGRLRAAGYTHFVSAGENLAWAGGPIATPATIVESWMDSPGHRANILRAAWREIGIGIAIGTPEGGEGITVASGFGTRRR